MVLLEAPGGYSKTTTLAEWDLADPRQFAWFTCRRWHRDPAVFVAAIVEALGQVTPIDPGILLSLRAPTPDHSVVLSLLQNAVAAIEPRFVLVIDDLFMVDEPDCLEVLDAILASLPQGSQMAVGTRSHPPLALARIRASRGLLEIGPGDLAMTRKESRALLAGTDLNPTDPQFELIFSRSEGWPAALYLAGIVLAESDDPAAAIESFSGDDRVMVEYFNQEFLGTLSADEVDLLVRGSILNEVDGPKLDYVLERRGSAGLLTELAQENMLLLPLDRTGSRFRCHHLFSDMLTAELRRIDPDAESILHRRASQWFESPGDMAGAAGHAVASGDFGFAGEMIWRSVPEMLSRGRSATLSDLVERSEKLGAGESPHLMLTEAHVAITRGNASCHAEFPLVARAGGGG
ncbi:MAG: hypothetical protein IPK93_02935 [Solirubrobacterales bacterium]|nr:hypothetical protein [Solirubrobacterales bacterium]